MRRPRKRGGRKFSKKVVSVVVQERANYSSGNDPTAHGAAAFLAKPELPIDSGASASSSSSPPGRLLRCPLAAVPLCAATSAASSSWPPPPPPPPAAPFAAPLRAVAAPPRGGASSTKEATVSALQDAAVGVEDDEANVGCARPCTSRAGDRHRKGLRLWCHIYLDERMLVPGLDLVSIIIGRGGYNTRCIFEKTGTKVRIRGHGSGHLEGDWKMEANVHLMIALSTEHERRDCFQRAFQMAAALAAGVSKRYEALCRQQGRGVPPGARAWVGGVSVDSLACLGTSLGAVPAAAGAVASSLPGKRTQRWS